MKIGELAKALLEGHTRYAKWRILDDLSKVLNVSLGVGNKMLEKICDGGNMHPDTKQAFMTNWVPRQAEVLTYLDGLIQDVGRVSTALGIPKADEYKKELLCKAVRMQFEEFFKADVGTDVTNIIPAVYQKLLQNPGTEPIISMPLYPRDAAHDYSKCKHYQMDIYGAVQHEIELQNMGDVPWVNRRLVFVDEKNKVRPAPVELAIPETRKNGIVKFVIELHGRGSEGRSILRWRMVDANNADCFPGEPEKFHIETETTFTPSN